MSDTQTRIAQLERELAGLAEANAQQQRSLTMVQSELMQLKAGLGIPTPSTAQKARKTGPPPLPVLMKGDVQPRSFSHQVDKPLPRPPALAPRPKPPRTPSQLEKLIGENLIAFIGIAILVLGVGIGAKYAIENDMVSPLTRIILGYVMGIALLGFAEKFRAKYANFSAVLLGGGMAVLYFITYAAYGFYDLIPLGLTFGLMVAFTAFTALAAIRYDKQIIALLGLVGAYAVPLLLSTGDGNILIFLTYVTVVNVGILIISFQRNWRILLYISFLLSWSLMATTVLTESADFAKLFGFLALFFTTFYAMAIVRPWIKKDQVHISDIIILVLNAVLFYGLGYFLFNENEGGEKWLGAFTLANGAIHLLIGMFMQKRGLTKGNLQPLLAGLALIFVVIAIPVQLDGNYVTLIWATIAALLLWMSQRAEVPAVRWFAYPLFALALISLLDDVENTRRTISYVFGDDNPVGYQPFFNKLFLTSGIVALAYGIGTWLVYRQKTLTSAFDQIVKFVFPLATLVLLYSMFFQEINMFFEAQYQASKTVDTSITDYEYSVYDYHIYDVKAVWASLYSLLFSALVLLAYLRFGRKLTATQKVGWLGGIVLGVGVLGALHFLGDGLFSLSELREAYLDTEPNSIYPQETLHAGLRYLGIVLLAAVLWLETKVFKEHGLSPIFIRIGELALHIAILWVLTSELLHWMDIQGSQNQYKLGVSILWGVYAVILVALGIWRGRAHLRIAAIVLFAITLVKLFVYDLTSLDTIGKTIVFVSLGILLLIISFLYTKYKDRIGGNPEA